MRKIIVLEHITLDGVIQAGGGPDEDTSGGFAYGGWAAPFDDDAIGAAVKKMLDMPVDLLLGRKTFDIWAAFWPQHGDIWPNVNTATKYVASNTMTSSAWRLNTIGNKPTTDINYDGHCAWSGASSSRGASTGKNCK